MSNDKGVEGSQVHVAGVFWFGVAFLIGLGILLVLVWRFQLANVNTAASPSFAAPTEEQPLQPSPNHPSSSSEDMEKLRAQQTARLHAGDAARHSISIDQAMDELLKSGALTRPWNNPATQPFVRPPNEPAGHSVENRT